MWHLPLFLPRMLYCCQKKYFHAIVLSDMIIIEANIVVLTFFFYLSLINLFLN
jgi:hypothetical protein